MLFTSYPFIFVFLPITLLGFFLLGRFFGAKLSALWLALASVFFYGYWSSEHVPLLLGSIIFNFYTGYIISRNHANRRTIARAALYIGVVGDLALLAYYKYADFFLGEISRVAGLEFSTLSIIMPIGISFFTFTQIAFLVDAWRGKASEYNFWHYLLFVTWFPHLIAGPILHHGQMMSQFKDQSIYKANSKNIATGLIIFIVGLSKKLMIADPISAFADPVFTAVSQGHTVGPIVAWSGAIAYTLQIYFDFSGYSDMAVGLSMMFGIALPINFNSPYKAQSIIEFWRRWHITLSQFLRDYLYITLGGNRHGERRRLLNLMLTMLLGGLWHGAAWTFVAWGALHGTYLCINHAYRKLPQQFRLDGLLPEFATKLINTGITFVAVIVAWIYFRASDISSAHTMLAGMLGEKGAQWGEILGQLSITRFLALTTFALVIVWTMPNVYNLIESLERKIELSLNDSYTSPIASKLHIPIAMISAALFIASMSFTFGVNVISPFIYFNF